MQSKPMRKIAAVGLEWRFSDPLTPLSSDGHAPQVLQTGTYLGVPSGECTQWAKFGGPTVPPNTCKCISFVVRDT